MTDANAKGKALEHAVASIEQAILRESPSYSTSDIRIEARKIIVVAGVKHEIDVWAEVSVASGYQAVFIFECKNWEANVGKNEIIVFSEKIRALGAARGFFVAKGFTSDAEAQARTDQRMKLLLASEPSHAAMALPIDLHIFAVDDNVANLHVIERGADLAKNERVVDIKTMSATLDGVALDLESYIQEWRGVLQDCRTNQFGTFLLPAGPYELDARDERLFELGRLMINGVDVERLTLDLKIATRVLRPAIASHFRVAGRGRIWAMEAVELGGAPFTHSIIVTERA